MWQFSEVYENKVFMFINYFSPNAYKLVSKPLHTTLFCATEIF